MYESENGLELLTSLLPPQKSWDDGRVQAHLPTKPSRLAFSLTDEEPGGRVKVGSLCEVTLPWESSMWNPEATLDPVSQSGLSRTLGGCLLPIKSLCVPILTLSEPGVGQAQESI